MRRVESFDTLLLDLYSLRQYLIASTRRSLSLRPVINQNQSGPGDHNRCTPNTTKVLA